MYYGNENAPVNLLDDGILALEESSQKKILGGDFSDTADLGSNDEDLSAKVEEKGKNAVVDSNLDSESDFVSSDEEVTHEAGNREEVGSSRKKGRKAVKVGEDQATEDNELTGNNLNEGNVLNCDFTGKSSMEKEYEDKKEEDRPPLMWEVWEEEDGRWANDNLEDDVDIGNQNDYVAETAEAPADVIMPLLRYQKEWLAWALKQEESPARGGILADEMGMGKTVQAIALVCAKRELKIATGESFLFPSAPNTSTQLPAIQATLVICPLVAVMQWVNEIDRFTSKGSNQVLVYHGSSRSKKNHQFSEYDFVITTYSIVESEYRRSIMPPKQKCQWCRKLLHEEKMVFRLRYFCGPDAIRITKQSEQHKKSSEIGGKSNHDTADGQRENGGSGENAKKRGCKRKSYKVEKERVNIVDQEFDNGLVENEHDGGQSVSHMMPILHSVQWERIVLDEAHYIKDRSCNTTKAVLALASSYKWALSGTPLQNRVGELYSLVRFLQIVPYSYYFCKDCDCRTLDYSSTTECKSCPHKSVRHFCWWNRNIASPVQAQGNTGKGRAAMLLLKHKILKSILLRRTKKGRAADLALPPRIVSLRRDSFDITEEDYYTSLYNETRAEFNKYVQAGTVMNNYAHIFDLLTRLRQAVDHPYLVVYSRSATRAIGTAVEATIQGEQECGLCRDPVEDPVVSSCAHVFCKSCLIEFSTGLGQISCPTCSKPVNVDFSAKKEKTDLRTKTTVKGFRSSSILNRVQLDDFQTSTKIEALREEILCMIERDGSAKGIVFSQFTSFIDLIHYSLQKSGVNCVQLDGSMSIGARDTAIKKFTDDPDCRIFLMSLKAGGVALNLTVASHVFLMDPWWNPAVERQAQDRIHRIGQYKPIRIVRFVIQNTIEERILNLQEKKELVFEG
ncbi:hypothetical protein Leryth_017846 [Lithospermum erythrorhizon]|nr:hypothetical protein Leryth_017846 [Lithospermum erythrorhizon]